MIKQIVKLLIFLGISTYLFSCYTRQNNSVTVLNADEKIYDETKNIPLVERRDSNYNFTFIIIEDSVSIYLLREGNGIPMVLLNGGPGNSSHSFIPYFKPAMEFCELIVYDPRGVGKSDWKPGKGYSTKQLINDLEKIRIELKIDRWIVAGWSFGGLVAQKYYLKYPDRVLGLVLINSSYSSNYGFEGESYPNHITDKERTRIREVYEIEGKKVVPVHSDSVSLKTMQEMVFNGYINGDWRRQFFFKPSWKEIAQIALYEWVHDLNYNQLVGKDGFEKDLRGRFKSIDIPVLLYYGKYDMTFSSDLPEVMKNEFLNSKLILLDSSSHFPFKEQPDLFFSELRNYILAVKPDE